MDFNFVWFAELRYVIRYVLKKVLIFSQKLCLCALNAADFLRTYELSFAWLESQRKHDKFD